MAVDAEPDEAAVVAGVALAADRHPEIESAEEAEGQQDHDEELDALPGAEAPADEPGQDDQRVGHDDGQGRDGVAEAGVNKQMVLVGAVGVEGGETLGHAPAHHAQAIHHRFGEDRHHQRDEADVGEAGGQARGEGRVAQDFHDKT